MTPDRRSKAAKARSLRRAFASANAWPRRPRATQRPSCQAALRAPTARALTACHGPMPSRFARTPRATHVDENDESSDAEGEDGRDEKRRAPRAAVACGPGRVQGLTAAARLAPRALDPARSSARPLLSGRWRAISPVGRVLGREADPAGRKGARPKARPAFPLKEEQDLTPIGQKLRIRTVTSDHRRAYRRAAAISLPRDSPGSNAAGSLRYAR